LERGASSARSSFWRSSELTAAPAGSEAAVEALFHQVGVIRATSLANEAADYKGQHVERPEIPLALRGAVEHS